MGKCKHGKDNSYLCDDLEGRDAGWEGSSKKRGDIYIYTYGLFKIIKKLSSNLK